MPAVHEMDAVRRNLEPGRFSLLTRVCKGFGSAEQRVVKPGDAACPKM